MAKKFEVGDIVVCVDPGMHPDLEMGGAYEVEISIDGYIGLGWQAHTGYLDEDRFRLAYRHEVYRFRKQQGFLKYQFAPGDIVVCVAGVPDTKAVEAGKAYRITRVLNAGNDDLEPMVDLCDPTLKGFCSTRFRKATPAEAAAYLAQNPVVGISEGLVGYGNPEIGWHHSVRMPPIGGVVYTPSTDAEKKAKVEEMHAKMKEIQEARDAGKKVVKDWQPGDTLRAIYSSKTAGLLHGKEYRLLKVASHDIVSVATLEGDYVGSYAKWCFAKIPKKDPIMKLPTKLVNIKITATEPGQDPLVLEGVGQVERVEKGLLNGFNNGSPLYETTVTLRFEKVDLAAVDTKPEPKPDPGAGCRLLHKDELVLEGDEFFSDTHNNWILSVCWQDFFQGKQKSGHYYRRRCEFKQGDLVRLVKPPASMEKLLDSPFRAWVRRMDEYDGKVIKIDTMLDKKRIVHQGWTFRTEWLAPATAEEIRAYKANEEQIQELEAKMKEIKERLTTLRKNL